MACPVYKHDYHVEQQGLVHQKEARSVERALPYPQTSEDALDKANELIHSIYGDMFRELAKV